MTTHGRTPAQEALLRTIAEQRKTDPLIGAKLGASEVFSKLAQSMKSDRGVHIESLLCTLGALAGYACQASTRAKTSQLVIVEGPDGKKYFFGDALNKLLAEDQYSVWGIAAGGAQAAGSQSLPDIAEIFAHVAETVGGAEFGIPRTLPQHKPKYLPINALRATWSTYLPLLKMYCADPAEWPILFAIAIQKAITMAKEIIEPSEALRLTMECAIPMSKVDLDAQNNGGALTTQSTSPAPSPRPVYASSAKVERSARPINQSAEKIEPDADEDERKIGRSVKIAFTCLAFIVAPLAYHTFFVASFVPTDEWIAISHFIAAGLSIALTLVLGILLVRRNVFVHFSTMRVFLCLGLTFAIVWWLLYEACCFGVSDIVARSIGAPMRSQAVAYNYGGGRGWRCSPRLTGQDLGRGKCISQALHSSLPMNVPVSIQGRRLSIGYVVNEINIEASRTSTR